MNVFLASVGNVEAFARVNGELVHFFSARSLTDSAIGTSVSAEEVRGGMGAQLLGQFFHTSNFTLSMTDAMFKLEYIKAQVGGIIEDGGYGLTDEQCVVDADGKIKPTSAPISLLEGTAPILWYNAPGSSTYATKTFEDGATDFSFIVPGSVDGHAAEGDVFCVHYYANKDDARKLIVKSEFIPEELVVYLTARLYAGDASAKETGKPVGSVTVKIPRFQLNGTVDLAMAMASAATVALEGTALAYDDDCEGGKYAEIVEYIGTSIYEDYTELVADADYINVGETPVIYAVGKKKTPMSIDNDKLTFAPALDSNGAIAAEGETKVTFTYTVDGVEKTLEGKFTAAQA